MPLQRDSIAVLDFGGQYAHLIATKIRSLGVHAEIRDPDDPVESFRHYKGIVLSGSPALSAHDEASDWSRGVLDLGLPVLGFCFGHQEIAKHAGGSVEHTQREYGAATLHRIADSPLFAGLADEEVVWMSHGDTVTRLAGGFVELGYSTAAGRRGAPRRPAGAASAATRPDTADTHAHRHAAIACEARRQYGLQFHPEVDDTPCGLQILRNFTIGICGARTDWAVGRQIEARTEAIRAEVGDRSVLLLASGGVDSTVAALLFQRALGSERLKLLHDNGLMRKDAAPVWPGSTPWARGQLHCVDASEDFLARLDGSRSRASLRRSAPFVEVFEARGRSSTSPTPSSARARSTPTPSRPRAASVRTSSKRITIACRSSRQ
jgi:GMP synthase (glutamine-hydrolysing)